MSKRLFLVSTPIGNLTDLSPRALECLKTTDLVVAEDTRVTRKLFQLLEISQDGVQFLSFHEHNQDQVAKLTDLMKEAQQPILVSDAGSPLLSDPGFPLVKEWLSCGYEILSIPGASAVTMALELSGLPPLPFEFLGFLPRKDEGIKSIIGQMIPNKTTIFFESPHRIIQTMDLLEREFPELQVFIGRELTKKFEEHFRLKSSDWSQMKESFKAKGEFVLALYKDKADNSAQGVDSASIEMAQKYLDKPTPKNLSKLLAGLTGRKSSEIYDLLNKR